MYARVTTLQVQPGRIDEGIQLFRDSILPTAKQQQGFKEALQLVDRKNNKTLVITLWETEADLIAGETSGYYHEQLAKAAHLLAGPPAREAYEVSVQA